MNFNVTNAKFYQVTTFCQEDEFHNKLRLFKVHFFYNTIKFY